MFENRKNENTMIHIALTQEEKEFLKKEAKARNMTMTGLVREALNTYLIQQNIGGKQ